MGLLPYFDIARIISKIVGGEVKRQVDASQPLTQQYDDEVD